MSKKKSEHYVNNKQLLEEIIVYRAKYLKSKENGLPKPQVTNYLGDCFLKIATHLSYKPNFVNYMFREDMISDGVENCIQYIHNFDPNKSILYSKDGEKKLTTKENALLTLLVRNINEVLDRQATLRAIWGDDNYFNGRSMDVYIAKLRKLLSEDPNIEIMNIHGIGFKLIIK